MRLRSFQTGSEFLRQASEPVFWQGLLQWTDESSYASEVLMAGAALQGLALTGTDEAWQILWSWRTRTNEVVKWNLASGLLDAVCNFHRVRKYGIEKTMDEFLASADLTSFAEWADSEEGRDWQAWALACVQLRRQGQAR
jgi:hypothetical protein